MAIIDPTFFTVIGGLGSAEIFPGKVISTEWEGIVPNDRRFYAGGTPRLVMGFAKRSGENVVSGQTVSPPGLPGGIKFWRETLHKPSKDKTTLKYSFIFTTSAPGTSMYIRVFRYFEGFPGGGTLIDVTETLAGGAGVLNKIEGSFSLTNDSDVYRIEIYADPFTLVHRAHIAEDLEFPP